VCPNGGATPVFSSVIDPSLMPAQPRMMQLIMELKTELVTEVKHELKQELRKELKQEIREELLAELGVPDHSIGKHFTEGINERNRVDWLDMLNKTEEDDIFISSNALIKSPQLMKLARHIAIDAFFYCTTQLRIGNYTHISTHVSVVGGKRHTLSIGNFCAIAAGARVIVKGTALKNSIIEEQPANLQVTAGARELPKKSLMLWFSDGLLRTPVVRVPGDEPSEMHAAAMTPVTQIIEDFVFIGSNAIIMEGATLAVGTIIAANSVVKTSTKPWSFYSGNPAKLVGKVDPDPKLAEARLLGWPFSSH